MKIDLIEIDQIWQEETTNYWFSVDGENWAISDNCGETTLLDCDGFPDRAGNHTKLKMALESAYTSLQEGAS